MKAKHHRQLLFLDRGDVEVYWRRYVAFGQLDAIIDRRHRAGAEDLAGGELGRADRRCEFPEQWLAIRSKAEQQVGHKDRHQPRESLPELGVHLLQVAVTLP